VLQNPATGEERRRGVTAWLGRVGIPRPGARLAAFGAYLLVALALTFPVWRAAATEYPGVPGDPMGFMNFLGWFPYALSHGLNPLLDAYVNLPRGSNMMWNTSVPLLSVVMWPVTAIFGVVVSYHVALLLALALDGWCTFLWLRRHVRHQTAAWLGGLLMILGPYSSTQATAHIHLVLFFLVPLLIVAVETVMTHPDHSSLRWGALIGLLAAAQLLLAEETLILFVVAVGTAIVISALVFPRNVRSRLVPLARTLGVAVVVLVVICGVPLAYQLLGPGRAVGLLQPRNSYVTDLASLLFPNGHTVLAPPLTAKLSADWTGGLLEADSYIGLPLLLVSLWTFRRWLGDRWLRVVGCATAAAVVWSLGPYLHINGVTFLSLPLPGRLLADLPVLGNVLPSRFALFIDLGLAAVVAVFTDRTVLDGTRRARGAGGIALLLVGATLAPVMPLAVWNVATPQYFLAGGDVAKLPAGTAVLLVPFGADSQSTFEPLLWQAESGFRIRLVSAPLIQGGPEGVSAGLPSTIQLDQHPWSFPSLTPAAATGATSASPAPGSAVGTTLACVMDALEASLPTTPCGPNLVQASRSDLHALGVSVIILGPMDFGMSPALQSRMEAFLTQLAGGPPRADQGVLVWSHAA
jgi:hypothetical protein